MKAQRACIGALSLAVALAVGLADCSKSSTPAPTSTATPTAAPTNSPTPTPNGSTTPTAVPTVSPTPSATPLTLSYSAIGASDAVGYGASIPCANPPLVANPTCPGGTGYVPELAKLYAAAGYGVTLNDLGISGAVIGSDVLALGNLYGPVGSPDQCAPRGPSDAIPGDFIDNELPNVAPDATLITIFAGGNDTNAVVNALGCGAGGSTLGSQQAFLATWIANFGVDFQNLVTAVHVKAPNAKIVVANVPNFAGIPYAAGFSTAVKGALQAFAVGIDTSAINVAAGAPLSLPTVDLLCNAQSYNPANFSSDGFHPNDAGYLEFADLFYAQATAATPTLPASSCSYMTLAVRAREPLTAPVKLWSEPVGFRLHRR